MQCSSTRTSATALALSLSLFAFTNPPKTGQEFPPCSANAGTISIDFWAGCLMNGTATITAVPGGDAVVPPGFELVYLLTETNGLIITDVSSTPSFAITSLDIHRIHPLVYDPNTLDLSLFSGGDASVYGIYDLIYNGLCAGLNVSGAPFKVKKCEEQCTASAGSISAQQPDLCLVEGVAALEGSPAGNAVVPSGFSVLHLLTSPPGGVITAAGPEPSFTVTSPGAFGMHTLIYDPATFNVSSIVPGVTTAAAVNAQLTQGGGSLCGSLDLTGAEFFVVDCTPTCEALAGTLSAADPEVCLENGIAIMDAVPNGDAVVPDGFLVAYLLVQGPGLIIQNVEPGSTFEWPLTGEYAVLSIVYAPFTIDPYAVQLGVTSAFDLNAQLLQGGGAVCGSLDLVGASFTVIDCAVPCTANAGEDGDVTICSSGTPVDLFSLLGGNPWTGGTWTSPNGDPHAPVFFAGVDEPGAYTYHVADVEPCPGDEAVVFVSVVQAPDAGTSTALSIFSTDPSLALFNLLGGSPDQGGTWSVDGLPSNGEVQPFLLTPGTHIFTYTVQGVPPCGNATATVALNITVPCTAGMDGQATVCLTDPPFLMIDLLGGDPCLGGEWIAPNGVPHSGVFVPGEDTPGLYSYTVDNGNGISDVAFLSVFVVECADPCVGAAGEDTPVEVCNDGSLVELFPLIGGDPVPGGVWLWLSIGNINSEITLGLYDSMIGDGGTAAYVVQGGPDCAPDTAFITISEIACNGIAPKPSTLQTEVASNELTTGTIENAQGMTLRAWPVPATETLRIELPTSITSTSGIRVIDAAGRSVNVPMTWQGSTVRLDVRELPSGAYQVILQNNGERMAARFLRSRD